jgi:prepilin-type N-terminal cleavage/methylation domain-containing protein
MRYCLGHKGFSLIELLAVLALIAVLLAIATPSFVEWMTKYNIEAQVRKMYGDLTNARAQALFRNRTHFVVGTPNSYQIIDDVNLNGNPDDAVILNVNTSNAMTTDAPPVLRFDNRGIATVDAVGTGALVAVCVPSTVSPDFDCIRIEQARIQLGKMTAQGGGCDAAICRAK